jgi:hypothetical protein
MNNIDKLEKSLSTFQEKVIPVLTSLNVEANKVENNIPHIRSSWCGSWFGYQHKLYYGNFEKPPFQDKFSVEWGSINGFSDKWKEREVNEVKIYLEQISYTSIDELEREYKTLITIVEDFYDETSLIIKTDEMMQAEILKENLLEGQKKLKFGEESKKFLKSRQPSTFMTRDTEAMNEGIFTPAILYYESLACEILSNVELVYKNIKSINYFIRWMKNKNATGKSSHVSEPTTLYIRDEIIEAIKSKNDGFNYKKLLKLISELNKNYLDSNIYSCLSLIRAITDHIPPLLGYETFEELANNYKGKKTDKNYMFNLLKDRPISDDSLHRPISKSQDLIDMDNVPNKLFLNRLLQECVENTVEEDFKHPKNQKKEKPQSTFNENDPNLRPLITAAITGLGGGPEGYFAEFDLTNAGKGLAVIKKILLGDIVVPIRTHTLSEKEMYHVVTQNLEGTTLRAGQLDQPQLEIVYENINKKKFRTIYKIELESRADKKHNIGKFTDPEFKVN